MCIVVYANEALLVSTAVAAEHLLAGVLGHNCEVGGIKAAFAWLQ